MAMIQKARKFAGRILRKCQFVLWLGENGLYRTWLKLRGKLPGPQPDFPEPGGKVIYLTFDDGPSAYTSRLLAVLARYNVKATFFVTNTKYIHHISAIAAGGHTVGSHGASHVYAKIYSSGEGFLDSLVQMERIILEKTGARPVFFRFPGGSSMVRLDRNPAMGARLAALLHQRGYRYVDWHADSRDTAEARTPGKVYRNVTAMVRDRDSTVVLQHDTKPYSVAVVERILIWGLRNGYTFLPLTLEGPDIRFRKFTEAQS